ncbi:right-handed parallel beta-helix repeat-containing protein [Flaviflagellibacter deserti]|uniref:Right-handed parallel beta-helix repeat-containing protein n=1 Tax=Flaviflagellibacter deserti TaxID=2267266 RepID=A0ABV9YZ16_9HYPH
MIWQTVRLSLHAAAIMVAMLGYAHAAQLIVDAKGRQDASAGLFNKVQDALQAAQPGDVIEVRPGTYREEIRTVRSGLPGKPITIQGQPGAQLVAKNTYDGRLFSIYHNYINVSGLKMSQAAILMYVFGGSYNEIKGNEFVDAGGECVRVKYFARNNLVENNTISNCGNRGFNPANKKKNGEGIYIGTAPEQLQRNPEVKVPANSPIGKPTSEPDRSTANIVRGNTIHTPAECVDIKESSYGNLVIGNNCSGNRDPDSAGFSARGDSNRFENNRLSGEIAGAGIRLGGDEENQGVNNVVVGNVFMNTVGFAVKDVREPQGAVCGNKIGNNEAGISRSGVDPTSGCN